MIIVKIHISICNCLVQSGFAELFERLDAAKERLGILGFGLSVNTMEDVFLRVSPEKLYGGDHDDSGATNGAATNGAARNGHLMDEKYGTVTNGYGAVEKTQELKPNPVRSYNRLTGLDLWVGQMRGLLTKRAIYTLRMWFLYAAMVRLRQTKDCRGKIITGI